MPITAWNCGVCGFQNAPLDHYATTDCGEKVHPSYAAAVLRRNVGHYGRGLKAVEVSDCLGCPRALGLSMADYAVDPVKHKASLSGTAWHEEMEQATWDVMFLSPDANMSNDLVVEQIVHGAIEGVSIIGKVDCLRPSSRLIEDWKGKADAKKALTYGLDDYVAQLSLYAELVEQDLKWRPTRGIIWLHDHKQILPQPVELWPLERVLAYKPKKGSEWTVAGLMKMAGMVRAGGVSVETIPLVGETMQMGGGDICTYCDVRVPCKGAF